MNRKNLLTLFWGAVFALSFAGSAFAAEAWDHWEVDTTAKTATDGLWTYDVTFNAADGIANPIQVFKAQKYAGNDGDKATLDLSKPFLDSVNKSIVYTVTEFTPNGWNGGDQSAYRTKKLNGGNFTLENGFCHLILPKEDFLAIGNFYGYSSLESITPMFPDSLQKFTTESCKSDDIYFFTGCNSLTGSCLRLAGMATADLSSANQANNAKYDQITFAGKVTKIGMYFNKPSSITNVNILTDHPVSIGGSAFADCTNLKTIRVGAKSAIASVGNNAFQKCTALERIDWDDHEPGYAFAPTTSMGNCPFGSDDNGNRGGQKLKQPLVLTNLNWTTQGGYRVPNVDPSAGDTDGNTNHLPFKNTGFTEVLLIMKPDTNNPDGLPYGFWAKGSTALFRGMTGITNAVIRYPQLSYLSQYLFADCAKLQTVSFDASRVAKMGGNVFDGCAKLERVLTPNVPRYDPSFAVSIPTMTNVGNSAFRNCSSLKSASLGSLGAPLLLSGTTDSNGKDNYFGVFGNAGLERAELMASELNLGMDSTYSWAFDKCISLKRVDISAVRVVGVGNGTFFACSALTDVYWTSPAPEKVGTNNEIFGSTNTLNHVMRGQWPATPSGVIPCITWTDSKSGTWKVHSDWTVPLAAWTPMAGAGFVILGQ